MSDSGIEVPLGGVVVAGGDGAAIVDAILALAKTLNLRVIAEGIENERHLSYLVRNECDLLQGFRCGRPVPAEEFHWQGPRCC